MKKIIVNADDFGLSPSVNRAIIDCFKIGNITSTTMMANMPGTEEAACLAATNKGLAVGLHFCLTQGKPLTKCPTLVDADGIFLSRPVLLKKVLLRKINPIEIATELQAQFQQLYALGINISHIDSHQHMLMNPFIFKAVLNSLRQFDLPIRIVSPPLNTEGILWTRPLKQVKQLWLFYFSEKLKKFHIPSNDRLVSIHDLKTTHKIDYSVYDFLIASTGGSNIIEVMVHPYILGDDILKMYRSEMDTMKDFLNQCEAEYRVLSERKLFENVTAYQLVNYAECQKIKVVKLI